jgi:hypothetical protein
MQMRTLTLRDITRYCPSLSEDLNLQNHQLQSQLLNKN